MNAKYRAKDRGRLVGALAIAALLLTVSVAADDGNLAQQLRVQQQKSRFQLMLEQVQQRARQRAVAGQAAAPRQSSSPSPVALGDWTESVRLRTISPGAPMQAAYDSKTELAVQQAYERDQRRILDYGQRRRALIAGARTSRSNSFQAKRAELVRFKIQNQRQSLQRKLRR